MCVAAIPAMMIGSAILGAGSQIYSGMAKSAQLGYEAKVAQANQAQANATAQDALDRGKIAARNQQWQQAQTAGGQVAAEAANGIETGFGSAAALAGDTATVGGINIATIRENSEREARGYNIQGANYGSQADAARMQADTIPISTALGVGSTILGTASQIGAMNAGVKLGKIG